MYRDAFCFMVRETVDSGIWYHTREHIITFLCKMDKGLQVARRIFTNKICVPTLTCSTTICKSAAQYYSTEQEPLHRTEGTTFVSNRFLFINKLQFN